MAQTRGVVITDGVYWFGSARSINHGREWRFGVGVSANPPRTPPIDNNNNAMLLSVLGIRLLLLLLARLGGVWRARRKLHSRGELRYCADANHHGCSYVPTWSAVLGMVSCI